MPPVTVSRAPTSFVESEIVIGARKYVGAQRLASDLGISVRSLSRWCAAGKGPPKIKIGSKAYFETSKIPEWLALAGRQIRPTTEQR
jgi:predicted DNA-binding transcriptional regulator AlpA